MPQNSPQAARPVDAVRSTIEREIAKRGQEIKPIEIVKMAISSYLAHSFAEESSRDSSLPLVESSDSSDLRRGTQAAIDRLLFNANYWRAAYETRIIETCTRTKNAFELLQAVSVWTKHTLRLNTLSPDEVVSTFERFCPPFALNNRRGSTASKRNGKGPLPDFAHKLADVKKTESAENVKRLESLQGEMEAEAAIYDELGGSGSLTALFTTLPAWCLQNRIELVSGAWWDDYDVMGTIIDRLHKHFLQLGFSEAICQYFLDSCYEALDAYHRDLIVEPSPYSQKTIPELIELIQKSRKEYPAFETDGYGPELPNWLISKEQLIWNIIVCAIYGPASSRPLLVDSPDLLASQGYTAKTDVITELARTSFTRYTSDRIASQTDQEFDSFMSLPADLRESSIAYISSIHVKLETLGYEVLPAGSCYPDRCVNAFTASEIECLAILEHRRWLKERQQAGWSYGEEKNVKAKHSPYMVPWEELPDRAKEWNRSAVRSIPALLASVNLAVVK